ncbi:unnamed protein product [Gongylonema pulchrum]|uniref:Protein kinase domain-containing protein n=1 Tax=Gongylonema pulchrum TaxID=637853 RepID=A0A183DKH3_9BILA|nr:unnamed protein product [Gongylonema pulchrum]
MNNYVSTILVIDKRKRDPTEEVDILKLYSHHPNIVKLYDVYEDNLDIYLVEELCLGGELLSTIMSLKYFSEREAAAVMLRLANAISYLHSNQVLLYDHLKLLRCLRFALYWRGPVVVPIYHTPLFRTPCLYVG